MEKIGKARDTATIRSDDNMENEIITISVQKYKDDDGIFFDLVASNGEDTACGGRMSFQEAIEVPGILWDKWDTFEWVDDSSEGRVYLKD